MKKSLTSRIIFPENFNPLKFGNSQHQFSSICINAFIGVIKLLQNWLSSLTFKFRTCISSSYHCCAESYIVLFIVLYPIMRVGAVKWYYCYRRLSQLLRQCSVQNTTQKNTSENLESFQNCKLSTPHRFGLKYYGDLQNYCDMPLGRKLVLTCSW